MFTWCPNDLIQTPGPATSYDAVHAVPLERHRAHPLLAGCRLRSKRSPALNRLTPWSLGAHRLAEGDCDHCLSPGLVETHISAPGSRCLQC